MSLSYRRSTLEDLINQIRPLAAEYGRDPQLMACLPEVWASLLRDGTIVAATMEDRTLPRGAQVVALGASVFVTNAFVAELESSLDPCLGAQIARRILQGRSPVLSQDAVRRANARDGLSLCILHDCYPGLVRGAAYSAAVKEKSAEAFFYLMRGYRLSQLLQYIEGDVRRNWMLSSGLKLRRDYVAEGVVAPTSPDLHPYLLGLTRAEDAAAPGTRASTMFVYTEARFLFTAKEQYLLRHALVGETDQELAVSCDISLSTVKKRWRVIYDRVMETDLDLLGGDAAEADCAAEVHRGVERRRYLLQYLRDHPEELNPACASR